MDNGESSDVKAPAAMRSAPLISVVICNPDSGDALRRSLDALGAQSLGADRFEVLVVDESSEEKARAGLETVSWAPDLDLRCVHTTGEVHVGGRNPGLSLARAPIVLFVEGDEILDQGCLEEHYLAHERHSESHLAVLGYTGLREEAERSPLMRYLADTRWRNVCCAEPLGPDAVDEPGFCARLPSFKRLYLLEHGAFNPLFPLGADVRELGFRLGRTGLRVIHSTEATSVLTRSRGLDEVCNQCSLLGKADWFLTQMHPEQEARSWARIDGVDSEWEAIAPLFRNIVKSARALDRFAHERCRAGLALDDLTTRLLYRAYAAALRASRVLGVVEAMSKSGFDPFHSIPLHVEG